MLSGYKVRTARRNPADIRRPDCPQLWGGVGQAGCSER